jgi:spermidine synthase
MSQYRHPRALSALDTPYAFVQVVEQKDGARLLLFNEGFAHQSVYRPGKPVRDEVFAQMALVPAMSRSPEAPRVLILGLGAGTMARAILDAWPRAHVVGVELDGQVLELARRYFDLPTKIETHRADARAWLRGEGRTFDAILVDCFRFPYIPFYLTTLEFFAELRERITDGGVIAVNVGRYRDEKALVEAIGLSLSSTFTEVVSLDASNSSNTLLFAGEPGLVQRLTRNAAALPTPARQIAAVLAHDLRPLERKAHEVFTDDRAPVEFLTDAILLSSLWRFRGKL